MKKNFLNEIGLHLRSPRDVVLMWVEADDLPDVYEACRRLGCVAHAWLVEGNSYQAEVRLAQPRRLFSVERKNRGSLTVPQLSTSVAVS
jgi:hypothetical protein